MAGHQISEKEGKKLRTLTIRMTALLFLVYILMMLVIRVVGLDKMNRYRIDSSISAEVIRNGKVRTYSSNYFDAVRCGDEVILKADLPLSLTRVTDPMLVLSVYNSSARVLVDGREVYRDEDEKGKDYIEKGGILYRIPLPEDDRSHGVEIHLLPEVNPAYTSIRNVYVVPAELARLTVLNGKEFRFLIFTTALIISAGASLYLLLNGIFTRRLQPALYMTVFCFFLTLWYVSSQHFLVLITDNERISGLMEYYALYIVMIPFCLYMAKQFVSKQAETVSQCLALLFTLYFGVSVILNYHVRGVNFTTLLPFLHGGIFISAGFFLLQLYRERRINQNVELNAIRAGLMISLIMAFLELIRWNLNRTVGNRYPVLSHSISFVGILVLVTTIPISLILRLDRDKEQLIQQKELERLAYTDQLTQIPNRSACYIWLELLRKQMVKRYSLLFFDVNDLKHANDNYGHEVGDRLIQTVAAAIRESFSTEGYLGRWGGDEFIAASTEDAEEVDRRIQAFKENLRKVNGKKEFPFSVSVAIGRVDVTGEAYMDPFTAVNLSDEDMYQNKKKYKEQHKITGQKNKTS